MHGGGGELALDDDVSLLETFFHITQLELGVGGDIADFIGLLPKGFGLQVLMQQGGTVLHGLTDIEHWWQHFIIDAAKPQRLLGAVWAGGGYGVYRVAL